MTTDDVVRLHKKNHDIHIDLLTETNESERRRLEAQLLRNDSEIDALLNQLQTYLSDEARAAHGGRE